MLFFPKPFLSKSYSLLANLTVVILLAAIFYGMVHVAHLWRQPLQRPIAIDLSFRALPAYTLLSLLRGFLAYGLSLLFTFVYGYTAAHSTRAERFMIPLLDILQSIPVLGFLPGTVLALVAIFPHTNIGLELASVIMMFTGQVWNMTFSFYQSLRTIPEELNEASSLYRFNRWQRFLRVELPSSSGSLAWNSMMAMAGGWFFLMICEAFSLGATNFRLPGLGAYMSVAIAQHNMAAILGGIVAMILMILVVNMCVWRPFLVWTQQFQLGEAGSDIGGSRVLGWLSRSTLLQRLKEPVSQMMNRWMYHKGLLIEEAPARKEGVFGVKKGRLLEIFVLTIAIVGGVWGVGWFIHLLRHLPPHGWSHVAFGAVWTFLRVSAAVILGTLWTLPVGVWIGQSQRIRNRLQGAVQVAASFPAPMLYPLVLVVLHYFGIGLGVGSIVLMTMGTQWYILFNVIAGTSAVPQEFREVAKVYGFLSPQTWRVVWIPSLLPYLITGWVTAAGGGWNASIVAEYIASGQRIFVAPGLGSLISEAASQGRHDLLAAGVLTMAVVVVLINRYLWKPLYRLAETRYVYQ